MVEGPHWWSPQWWWLWWWCRSPPQQISVVALTKSGLLTLGVSKNHSWKRQLSCYLSEKTHCIADSTHMQRRVMSHRVTSAHVSSHQFPRSWHSLWRRSNESDCRKITWIHWPFHGGILNTLPTLPPKKLALCRISRLFWFHKITILDGWNLLHAT